MVMDSKQQAACREVLDAVLAAKDGRRVMATIFRALPDKTMYPDYYEAIPEPQSLDGVKAKLDKNQFPSADEAMRCLQLVFLNAKHYNEDGSPIFEDAKTLEGLMLREWSTRAEQGSLPFPPGSKPVKRQPAPKASSPVPTPVEAPARSRKRKPESQPPQPLLPPSPPTVSPVVIQPAKDATPPPQQKTLSPYCTLPIQPAQPPPAPMGPEAIQLAEDAKMVAALERSMQKWSGPQEAVGGWFGQGMPHGASYSPQSYPMRIRSVLHALIEYRDPAGYKLSITLSQVGEASSLLYLSYSHPISLAILQERAQAQNFANLVDFDIQVVRLFEKARRWFAPGSLQYGHVLTLQRMYSALTSPSPPALTTAGTLPPSPTAFAGLPAGPGNAKSFHETNQQMRAGAAPEEVGLGVTTFRVGTRNRIFLEEARWKGVAYRLGDYVHLINPDDPTRPTIGQIFRTYIPDKAPGRLYATVCWYYRPEQTVHPANRSFYENEVFKTGHFADHPIEDILERVGCQFFTKYVRGRSLAPEYYPGWPLYICNSRYNDRDEVTVRIKNWGSCIPEELRKTSFMSITPFPTLLTPRMVPSPFLRGAQGPGCTGYLGEGGGGDAEDDEGGSNPATPRQMDPKRRDRQAEKTRRLIREGAEAAATSPFTGPPMHTAPPFPQYAPMSNVPAPALYPPPVPQQPAAYVHRPQQMPTPPPLLPSANRGNVDRSIAAMVGGVHNLAQIGIKENLPRETTRMLERDSVNDQVLWFSAPPAPPGSIYIPEQPTHSLEYLSYLSKRKLGQDDVEPSKKPCRFSVNEAIADDEEEVARWTTVLQTFLEEEPVRDEMPRSEAEKTPEEMATALRDLVDSLV